MFNESIVEKFLPFVKLGSSCKKPVNQHFWWDLVFLWSSTSSPGRVPWLHGHDRNARSVTNWKYLGLLQEDRNLSPKLKECLPTCVWQSPPLARYVQEVTWYSASLVIRTSIIQHPNYPNAKFHKPHPHLQKPRGSWQLRNLAKWCFPIIKKQCRVEEKLDICKLMATDRSYGALRKYTIEYSCKISKKSPRKWPTWAWRNRCLKIDVQPKLDDNCIFGLGWQQSEKAMLVTRAMLR